VLVASGNVLEVSDTRAFTRIRIEARIPGGATTVVSRGYAYGIMGPI
jgi:hypothetical protein